MYLAKKKKKSSSVQISSTLTFHVLDQILLSKCYLQIVISRGLLHTKRRQEDTHDNLETVLGVYMISCDIEKVGPEITVCSQGSTFLPPEITEDVFNLKKHDKHLRESLPFNCVSVTMDDSLVTNCFAKDRKGLLYDITRTLKDYNIQAYTIVNFDLI